MRIGENRSAMSHTARIALSAVILGTISALSPASNAVATTKPADIASVDANRSCVTTVTVIETEFRLELSQTTFTPGQYAFAVTNAGTENHALEIAGPGLSGARTAVLAPGESTCLTVTLQPGDYELWCPVDEHKEKGMDIGIQVRLPDDGTGQAWGDPAG